MPTDIRVRSALLPLLVLALAAPARAQGVEAALDDLRLATAVRLALAEDPATAPAGARVSARAGAVVVDARWPSPEAEARAASLAGAVQGVASIAMGDGPALPAAALGTGGAAEPDEPIAHEEPAPAPEPIVEPEPILEPLRPERPAPVEPDLPPGPAPVAPAQEAQGHIVRLGDTLYSIARRYDTTVEALQRLNGLGDSTEITLGRRLVVSE